MIARSHTRRAQKLPCLLAAGQCTFAVSVARDFAMRGIAAPAGDLERRAENLCAHKFGHGEDRGGGRSGRRR